MEPTAAVFERSDPAVNPAVVVAEVEDTIGGDAPKLAGLAVVRKVLAYATGGPGIEWPESAAKEVEARGGRVIWVDQSDGIVTRLGDVDDVENGAKTLDHFIVKAVARKAIGWRSCCYLSLSRLLGARELVAAHGLQGWAKFGVADWGLTVEEAVTKLYGDIVFVQYASPTDQGGLVIPGTDVRLDQANADLSVSLASWMPLPKAGPRKGRAELTLTETGGWSVASLPGDPIRTGAEAWAAKVTTRNGAWGVEPLPPER